jgi:hypothetical protein
MNFPYITACACACAARAAACASRFGPLSVLEADGPVLSSERTAMILPQIGKHGISCAWLTLRFRDRLRVPRIHPKFILYREFPFPPPSFAGYPPAESLGN